MRMSQFLEDLKRDNPNFDWDDLSFNDKLLDVIKMSDLYRLTVIDDIEAHVHAYVIDRSHELPVAYMLFSEASSSDDARITKRLTLTDGTTKDERVANFVSRQLENGFVEGGRACARDCVDVEQILKRNEEKIHTYTDFVRDTIDSQNCDDRVSAVLRLSIAAEALEYAAAHMRRASRFLLDNLEGDPHLRYIDYEFDVDDNVLPPELSGSVM